MCRSQESKEILEVQEFFVAKKNYCFSCFAYSLTGGITACIHSAFAEYAACK